MSVWYEKNPELLAKVRKIFSEDLPYFEFKTVKNRIIFMGRLELTEEGKQFDSYFVEISFPNDFPSSLPEVREMGGRLPKIKDRHVNELNSNLCLFLPEDWYFEHGNKPFDLRFFLSGPVRDFFISQSYFEKKKKWPFGDWPHSFDGKIVFYFEKLNTKDPLLVLDFLKMIVGNSFTAGHEECICGSKMVFRKCHQKILFELRNKVPRDLLSDFLNKSENVVDKITIGHKLMREAIKKTLAKKEENGFSASN